MTVVIGFACMIAFTVAANLLMKLGAMSAAGGELAWGLVNWRTLAGLCCFGAAGLLYAWLLKFVPLHVAQSFAAVQYIAVILAAALLLPDAISIQQWLGIAFVGIGVLLIGVAL